ncbi:MAG: carbamoyltransferase [Anaerolineae bacterium]|nr:carbamoyltransferase [Anaerolineae bacterium]
MIVLGIIDSKPSTAAIMRDGEIVAAVAEERLCRMKLASGMPRTAIQWVLAQAGLKPEEVDQVAVAQEVCVYEPEPIPWKGWFTDQDALKTYRFDNLSAALAPIAGRFPLAWKLHHQLKRLRSRERPRQLPLLLREQYGLTAPIRYYDHHYCHATTAYFTGGMDEALIITLDGGGDGQSGSVYLGQGGRLTKLAGVDSFNSLGNFYSYVTEICGFRAEKDEGKITGLAALGEPVYADILRQFIGCTPSGHIRYKVPMYYHSAIKAIRQRLPTPFDPTNLAASVQLILEEVGLAFVRHWQQKTGLRHIVVAGGVFANVKFNQRVHELPEVDRFFVHPAMDDSGLAVGAAMAALSEQPHAAAPLLPQRLANVYFGPAYSDEEIEQAVAAANLSAVYLSDMPEQIAALLAEGFVVARFTGRMEYGPRALGHRSIMYQTTDPSVNDWLNEHLKRTEFMPFAPATLVEHASACYENLSGAEDPARFMTITFDCTPQMRAQSPGVVHVDGTARPQLLDPETAPDFYAILTAYHRRTGIPSLINTSFNMHGEPIVCTPQDAIRSFLAGNLDVLAMGNWLLMSDAAAARRFQGGSRKP